MKALAYSLAAFFIASHAAYASQVKEQMVDPVVKIDEDCSGTNVNLKEGKFILTAAHCTTDRGEGFVVAEIRTTDKDHKLLSYKKIFYDTVRFDSEKDLALLKVRDPGYNPPAATIAEKLLVDEGSDIWVIGYPSRRHADNHGRAVQRLPVRQVSWRQGNHQIPRFGQHDQRQFRRHACAAQRRNRQL